jgi:hypothetical protein
MATYPWDVNGEAHAALVDVVKDYGVDALSNPQILVSLLKDLIPDLPRESNVLAAAAEVNVAGILRDRLAQHISMGAAVAQAAAMLEERTALAPQACQWAVRQMAEMIGLPVSADQSGPQPAPANRTATSPRPVREQETVLPQAAPLPVPQPAPQPWATPQPPAPAPQVAPRPVSQPPTPRSGTAKVAGGAGLVCALSVPLQLVSQGGVPAWYGWVIALCGLVMFAAAIMTLSGAARQVGAGMIFGAGLTMVPTFIRSSVTSGLGGGFVAASVLTTVTAVIAAVIAVSYFARDIRRANLRTPLAVAYVLAALGFIGTIVPGLVQIYSSPDWLTVNGLVGSGVNGRSLFAGLVDIVALILVAVIAGLLPSGTGVRTGVIMGWLAVNAAEGLEFTLLATQPGVRAGTALYAAWVVWAITLVLGVALLVRDHNQPVASAVPTLVGGASA